MVEFVVYTENGSKNGSGSYKDHSEAKQVKHFVNKSLGIRCICSNCAIANCLM